MQYLVHKNDLFSVTDLPTEAAREEFVLVRTVTQIERLRALEAAVPELAQALVSLNSGLVVLSEQIENVFEKMPKRKGKR